MLSYEQKGALRPTSTESAMFVTSLRFYYEFDFFGDLIADGYLDLNKLMLDAMINLRSKSVHKTVPNDGDIDDGNKELTKQKYSQSHPLTAYLGRSSAISY